MLSAHTRTSTWDDFHLGTIGASALHAATWSGSEQVVKLLLEAGQHPDTRDEWGMTPTMVAIMRLYLVTMRSIFRGRRAFQRNLVVDVRSLHYRPHSRVWTSFTRLGRDDEAVPGRGC